VEVDGRLGRSDADDQRVAHARVALAKGQTLAPPPAKPVPSAGGFAPGWPPRRASRGGREPRGARWTRRARRGREPPVHLAHKRVTRVPVKETGPRLREAPLHEPARARSRTTSNRPR
jgi:hypothetical protein